MNSWLLLAQEHHAKWNEMSLSVHDTTIVICTFIVVMFILTFALLAKSGIGLVPSGWGAVFEHIFDWLDDVARSFMGPEGRKYVPLAMSFFLFILISNWSGLIPWPKLVFEAPAAAVHNIDEQELQPAVSAELPKDEVEMSWESPTASFNTTLALAFISFLAFNIYGIWKKVFPPRDHGHSHEHGHDHAHDHSHDHDDQGHAHHPPKPGGLAGIWEWIAHFWQPIPSLAKSFEGGTRALILPLFFLFLGLNIVEEVARLMSLSIRLYGNIFGEHQVKVNLINAIHDFSVGKEGGLALMAQGNTLGGFGYLGMAAMLWGTALFATCLGALAGFIQAMVFAMLSLSYIAHAVADDH